MSTSSLPADTPVLNPTSNSDGTTTSTSPPDSTAAPSTAPSTSSPPTHADASSLKPPLVPPVRKVSAALLKASLASLSADDPAFSFASLAPSLPLVLAQSANGVDAVRRTAEFVERIVRAKQAYAAALLSAVTDASKPSPSTPLTTPDGKLAPTPPRPRSGSTGGPGGLKPRSGSSAGVVEGEIGVRYQHTWKTLLDIVQAEGVSDAAAARAYHETVAAPLLDYHRELQQKHAALAEHAASMETQLRQSQERLLQTKIAVVKLVEAQQHAEEREAHERDERARAEGGKGGVDLANAAKSLKTGIAFLFKSKDKQLTEALNSLTSDELRQQAYEARQGYTTAVQAANHRSETFYEHDLPTVLRQIQMMEATRLETLRLHLEQLSLHINGVMAPADQRVASFSAAVSAMQTREDLEDYVKAITAAIGATSTRPNPFVDDLPFTADDIKRGTVNAHPAASVDAKDARLFGCSLMQVMEGQRGRHPGQDVPWLVPVLCEQIKKGGKPVFATAVDSDEVLKARRRLEEGESLQSDDPELAAAVLKMWLRDLEPHVVAGEAYTQGVEAAKASELSSDAVLRVYRALPEVNQRVVQWVASTLMEVAGREAGAMDTAATVLTPHLMQSPTVEPTAMLASINAEIAFVQALLLTVSTHHPVGRTGNGVSGDLPRVEVTTLEDSAIEHDEESHK